MPRESPSPATLLLVDDHAVFRLGLKSLLEEEGEFSVEAEADNAHDALRLVHERGLACVIIDVVLRGKIGGLELVRLVHQRAPSLPILVMSMHDEDVYAERAIALGASGYANKSSSPDELVGALRKVIRGEVALSHRVTQRLLRRQALDPQGPVGVGALSNRELEVFELLGRGVSTREVAERLHLSVKTVDSHRARIRDKLELPRGAALVHAATIWVASGGAQTDAE